VTAAAVAICRFADTAPSALRYYDDAGLLRPAQVEPESGYRRYALAQVPEGILIRELRGSFK
jgi:DNA-binding transcriptional MerR regulator